MRQNKTCWLLWLFARNAKLSVGMDFAGHNKLAINPISDKLNSSNVIKTQNNKRKTPQERRLIVYIDTYLFTYNNNWRWNANYFLFYFFFSVHSNLTKRCIGISIAYFSGWIPIRSGVRVFVLNFDPEKTPKQKVHQHEVHQLKYQSPDWMCVQGRGYYR